MDQYTGIIFMQMSTLLAYGKLANCYQQPNCPASLDVICHANIYLLHSDELLESVIDTRTHMRTPASFAYTLIVQVVSITVANTICHSLPQNSYVILLSMAEHGFHPTCYCITNLGATNSQSIDIPLQTYHDQMSRSAEE